MNDYRILVVEDELTIAALLICRPAHKFAARSGEQTQA